MLVLVQQIQYTGRGFAGAIVERERDGFTLPRAAVHRRTEDG